MMFLLLLALLVAIPLCTSAYSLTAVSTTSEEEDVAWFLPKSPIHFTLHLDSEAEVAAFALLPDTLPLLSPSPSSSYSFWAGKPAFALVRQNATTYQSPSPYSLTPAVEGTFNLTWGGGVNTTVHLLVEVSCSDGKVCNGMEHLTNLLQHSNKAVCTKSPRKLCDDQNGCTKDACVDRGVCAYKKLASPTKKGSSCKPCKTSSCKPQCGKNKQCGFDQCFGECGACKPTSEFCANFKCLKKDDQEGTCLHPIQLTPQFAAKQFVGDLVVQVPMAQALHVLTPRCDPYSSRPEIMYQLDLPNKQGVGYTAIEVRTRSSSNSSTGIANAAQPSTMVIIEANPRDKELTPTDTCLGATYKQQLQWACEREFSDFGEGAAWSTSTATWMMKPGFVYYIAIERGIVPGLVVEMQVRLVPECTPNCATRQCGESGCPGVDCGTCTNAVCLTNGTCSACVPRCDLPASQCGGADGCGGTCQCLHNALDRPFSPLVLLPPTLSRAAAAASPKPPKPTCDHFAPYCTYTTSKGVVTPGCSQANHFCASTCECVPNTRVLPDLSIQDFHAVLDDDYSVESESSCAYQEGCLAGLGKRRLLRFDTNVFNQGAAAFVMPYPPQKYPDLFEFAPCHGHWHTKDFLLYQVVDNFGNVVAQGEKRSFCLMDMAQHQNRPDAPCKATYSCSRQGLSVGWTDLYDKTLDCQFIDVTHVLPGSYTVRQCVNPRRKFLEATFENNCVEARVTIGATQSPISSAPTPYPTEADCGQHCPASWLGDRYCDNSCNTAECGFDHGDCKPQAMTCGGDGKCNRLQIGDGICDAECNVPECDFDGGDCS